MQNRRTTQKRLQRRGKPQGYPADAHVRATSAPRNAAHAASAPRNAMRALHLLLIFLLTFNLAFFLEMRFAYGTNVVPSSEEVQPVQEDPAAPGSEQPFNPTTNPVEEDNTPSPAESNSYAFVKLVEIIQEDMLPFPADARALELILGKTEKYQLYARVVVVPDSNDENSTVEYICTPENNLAAQTDGLLPDLVWTIRDPNQHPEQSEQPTDSGTNPEGTDQESSSSADQESEETKPEEPKWSGAQWATIDAHTGLISLASPPAAEQETPSDGTAPSSGDSAATDSSTQNSFEPIPGIIRCLSEAGKRLSDASQYSYVSDEIGVVINTEQKEEEPKPTEEEPKPVLPLAYLSNGGTGTMEPTQPNADGQVIVADCTFTAPEGKVFASWNTRADGTGTSFAPGQVFEVPAAETEGEQGSTSAAEAEGEQAGTSSGEAVPGQENEQPSSADSSSSSDAASSQPTPELPPEGMNALYAQWTEDANAEGEDPGDGVRIRISYTPVPLGQPATMSPVVSGLGHGVFSYLWEVSSDNGQTWEFTDSGDAAALIVPTTEENLGKLYRVTLYGDRILDEEKNVNHVFSEPVELKVGTDTFSVTLSYEPKPEGESALFSLTTTELDATFEWQVSSDGGRNWQTIPDATSMSYAIATTPENLGNWYRVKATRAVTGEDGKEQTIYSNIQMLVAIVEDAEPIPIDQLSNPDSFKENNTSSDAIDDNSSSSSSSSQENANSSDSSSSSDDYIPLGDELPFTPLPDPSYTEPEPLPEPEPTPEIQPAPEPAPAPEPTPAPEVQPAPAPQQQTPPAPEPTPEPEPTPQPEPTVEPEPEPEPEPTVAEETPIQPGEKWRALSVIPPAEEIQTVLADNPFAPLVAPFIIALIAAGMAQRYLSFRQQKQQPVAQ